MPVLPVIPAGFSREHVEFPGTISVSESRLKGYVEDVCKSLKKNGFSSIIIVEDDKATQDALRNCLKQYVQDEKNIRIADIEKSTESSHLFDSKGNNLLKEIDDIKNVLVCFDLELKPGRELIPHGLRLLYKARNDYPDLPCIVVTGYRSQEHRSLGLKSGSFLLKPFTQEDVEYAIENAVRQHQVTWIYPKEVQRKDADAVRKVFDVEKLQEKLQQWVQNRLRDHLVHLQVDDSSIKELCSRNLSDSDLFVLDIAPLDLTSEDCQKLEETLRDLLVTLRQANPNAPVIIVWPFDRWKEMDRLLFGPLRRLFRDGVDQVLYKPTWLFDYEGSTESLVGQFIRALKRPSFNVKFTVSLPVAPFIGRFDWEYVRKGAKGKRMEQRFAPFLIPLVRAFGLSATLNSLKVMSNAQLKRLAQAVQNEVLQNRNRWGTFEKSNNPNVDRKRRKEIRKLANILNEKKKVQGAYQKEKELLCALFDEFITKLKDPSSLQYYLTLEDWIRAQCFPNVQERLNDVVRLFGGETRFDLLARGSWLDESGTRV